MAGGQLNVVLLVKVVAVSVCIYASPSEGRTLGRLVHQDPDTYRMVQHADRRLGIHEHIHDAQGEKVDTLNAIKKETTDIGDGIHVGIRIPNFPARSGIPGGLAKDTVPMLIFFSFDDGVREDNIEYYRRLFPDTYKNPNGCPARATFFDSGDATDYNLVKELYDAGHEIASHSRTHRFPASWWNDASYDQWQWEIEGQREDISAKAGIPKDQIIGMRAPFLALGHDTQYDMLEANKFSFDSSMAYHVGTPMWPFTMDAKSVASVCNQGDTCPDKDHKLWEVPLFAYEYEGRRQCTMLDVCQPNSEEDTYDYIEANFNLHYNSPDRPPFGLNMHATWFHGADYRVEALKRFIEKAQTLKDVYIVPITKVLLWMDSPTPLDKLKTFKPFSC